MKIHIVQKGDTLWELAKQYNVDFEELKQANSHLSSPDMIMPGMKIRIPSTTKPVKKQSVKEKQKQKPKQDTAPLYKDTTPKAMPVIEEDDKKPQPQVQPKQPQPMLPPIPTMPFPQLPVQPIQEKVEKPAPQQMPNVTQEVKNYTMINLPKMTQFAQPKKDKPKAPEQVKQVEHSKPVEQPVAPQEPYMPPMQIPAPMPEPMPMPVPEYTQPYYQPMPQMMPCHHPYYYQPCPPVPCPPMPICDPMMYQPAPAPPMVAGTSDCGCGGGMQPAPPPTVAGTSDCGCGDGMQPAPEYYPMPMPAYPAPHSPSQVEGNHYYGDPVTNMPKLQTNLSMTSFGGYEDPYRGEADEPESNQGEKEATDKE